MCIDTIPSSFKEEQKPQSASETLFLNAFFFSFFVSALLLKKKTERVKRRRKKKAVTASLQREGASIRTR
jgi:hypothetical protein